jgi:uncharacterized damage-inducible protein DinB
MVVAGGRVEQGPKWFERKFDFSFPVELRGNVFARLRGTPARLEELVRGFSQEVMTRKPDRGWSAQEQAGHLADLEPLWLARVEDYAAGAPELTVADLQNRKTDEANHNERRLEEILGEFRAARGKLVSRAEETEDAQFSRAIPHPRLKTPMRLVDHLYFVAEHDDHHLARIWDLVSSAK